MDVLEAIDRGRKTGRLSRTALIARSPFDCLPGIDAERLAAGGTWILHTEGAEITGPGAEDRAVFFMADGHARVYLRSPQVCRFTALVLSQGDFLDLADLPPALTDNAHAEAVSAKALVFRFRKDELWRALLAHAETAGVLLDQMQAQRNEVAERLFELLAYDATTRLAHILGRLALTTADCIVRRTRDRLGEEAEMSRVQVTRSLDQLRERGLIWYPDKGREITVLDPHRLLAFGVRSE